MLKSYLRMLKTIIIVILVLVSVLLAQNFFKQAVWKGFYYPNENDLFTYIDSPGFSSLDECREWVTAQVNKYNPNGYGYDYECGKNCEVKEGLSTMVCEKTVE